FIPMSETFLLGHDLSKRLGLPPMTPIAPSTMARHLDCRDLGALLRNWRASLRSGRAFSASHRLRQIGGAGKWLRFVAKPASRIDRQAPWYGACIDIDETVTATSAISPKDDYLIRFVDNVQTPIWASDAKGHVLYFNQAFCRQIECEPEDLARNGYADVPTMLVALAHPDDQRRVEQALSAGFSSGEPFLLKYRQMRGDGGCGWVAGCVRPVRDDAGKLQRWYGVWDDVDRETTSREVLHGRENQLLLVLQSLPAVVWEMDQNGRTRFFNRRPAPFQHYESFDEVEDTTELLVAMRDSIHPDDQALLATGIERSIETNVGWHLRYRRRAGDGWRWLEGRTKPLFDESGQLLRWYGMAIDVDDEVRANEGLRAAHEDLSRLARVASLAELSASIAHEISQPLAAVAANAGACFRWLAAESPNIEMARLSAANVYKDANVAADIIERVRTMFQLKQGDKSIVPINAVISDACAIYKQEEIGRTTALSISLDPANPEATVDALQIRQVLINLLRNASEAMGDLEPWRHAIDVKTEHIDDELVVTLEDRGPGIVDAERIFETFYTTKPSGTGLGLPICKTIVALHGGRIWAENTNRGARVAFALKLALT
ncbi:MAG: PAS domain-containing sensor histidine kinase, partial [Hyphomicrobiales bacterium]